MVGSAEALGVVIPNRDRMRFASSAGMSVGIGAKVGVASRAVDGDATGPLAKAAGTDRGDGVGANRDEIGALPVTTRAEAAAGAGRLGSPGLDVTMDRGNLEENVIVRGAATGAVPASEPVSAGTRRTPWAAAAR